MSFNVPVEVYHEKLSDRPKFLSCSELEDPEV